MGFRQIFEAILTHLYFLLTPHNDEKTAVMQSAPFTVHSRLAPPFVDTAPYSSTYGIPHLVDTLETNAHNAYYIPFYDSVSRCVVTSVRHLRSAETMHEIVVVEYALSLGPGRADTRFARFERFRVPSDDARARRRAKSQASSEELSQLLATTARVDSVRIAATRAALEPPHYETVQALSALPAGALDMLDAVALAGALGETAHQYSVLRHMCQWYAAALFLLLRTHAGASADRHTLGPAYAAAGTVRVGRASVRLVNVATAALVWPARDARRKEVLAVADEVFYRRGRATEDVRAKLRAAIERDAALLGTKPLVVTAVQAAAETQGPDMRRRIKEYADTAEETEESAKRTRVAEMVAQAEREARLHAETVVAQQEAQIAQLLRLLGPAGTLPTVSAPNAAARVPDASGLPS